MITRNIVGKVDESVRRTILELSSQVDALSAEVARLKAAPSNGATGLTPFQLQQVSGLIAGRSQAVIGQDIQDPQLPGQIGATGTVQSVGLTVPTQFAVGGSPVTSTGTIAITWNVQTKNTILAGPASGADAAPTFRVLDDADMPAKEVKTDDTFTKVVAGAPYANDAYIILKDHAGNSVKVMTTA